MAEEEKAYREKYWGELDADAKIARLREVVRRMQREQRDLMRQMGMLRRHAHLNGKMLSEIREYDSPEEERRRDLGDDVYF